MRRTYMLIGLGIVIGGLLMSAVVVLAGSLDPSDGPTDPLSQMYTLEQIYDRLNTGAAVTKMTTFAEPGSGPGTGTMHSLDEIMAKAPAPDNTDGATKAEVANGKKYWSLRTDGSGGSSWGLETGQLYGGCTCSGTLNGTRWCDNGDGTVTDMTTCLVWLQKADWGGRKKWEDCTPHSHDDAHTRAGILKAADERWLSDGSVLGDWRLPTKTELVGITTGHNYIRSGSMYAFTGVQSNIYWSSTTNANDTSSAWSVWFIYGGAGLGDKAIAEYVWPVRGGQ